MIIVTLPKSAEKNPRSFARDARKNDVDVLEIRADLTPAVVAFDAPLPILFSPRGKGLKSVPRLSPAFIDLDVSELALRKNLPEGAKLIASFHDHEGTPDLKKLKAVVAKLCAVRPWAVKIAVTVTSYEDLLTLRALREHIDHPRTTILGMGPMAHLTRVLSPLENHLTYASLGAEASAPGQLSVAFHTLLKNRNKPQIYGILGGPQITASLSPLIHNALFLKHGIDALYSCFPSTDFTASIKALEQLGLAGLSVTAPFKRDAFEFARTNDAVATSLGVTNTLVKSGKGWSGFNTDIVGIEKGYPLIAKAAKIAVLGAGGAVPSVISAVRTVNAKAEITVFVRDPKKAAESLGVSGFTIQPLENIKKASADLVICAVSEDVRLPLPKSVGTSATAIDLRYGKPTNFIKDARSQGFHVHDGTAMLIHQALKQFEYFTGKKSVPDDAAHLAKVIASFTPKIRSSFHL